AATREIRSRVWPGSATGYRSRHDNIGLLCDLALAELVALFQQLGLAHVGTSVFDGCLGFCELGAELKGGAFEIVAPLQGRLSVGGIGEMAGVMDADPVLLVF